MPESKTIEIDEIVTPGGTSAAKTGSPQSTDRSGSASRSGSKAPTPDDPFASLRKSLGWKTRATLWATQKFLYLRSKPWGKWVIVPLSLLVIILAIPLGLIFIVVLAIRSFLRSFSR